MATLDSVDLKKAKDLVEVSKAYLADRFTKARRPAIMRRWFSGDHYGPGMPINWIPKRDRVIVNLSQGNVIAKVSRLAHTNPAIQVKGRDDQSREMAADEQQYLEYKWAEIDGLKAARAALFDCKIMGTGALASGWTARRARDASATQLAQDGGTIRWDVDRPVVRHVWPEALILDPDSPENIQKGWWCGERIVIPLSRIKKMPRYAHVADKLIGVSEIPEDWWSTPSTDGDADDEHLRGVAIDVLYLADSLLRVELCHEISDEPLHVGDEPGVDYPLDDEDKPYFPYVIIKNIPDYNGVRGASTHFGISDIEVTETQQIEINTSRSLKAMHRRMSSPAYLAKRGLLLKDAKAILQEGKPKALVEIEMQQNEDIRRFVTLLPQPTISPEVYTTEQDAKQEMGELTRTTPWDRSGKSPNADTATEAAMMQAGSESGGAWEQQDFENFVCEVLEQVGYLLHRWGSQPDILEQPDQEAPVQMTGVALKGRYEHIIVPSSMEPPNVQEEEAKWYGRLQGILPFAEQGADPRPLLKQWLDSFDAPNPEEILQGYDNLAKYQQALMQAGQQIQMLQQAVGQLTGQGAAAGEPVEQGAV